MRLPRPALPIALASAVVLTLGLLAANLLAADGCSGGPRRGPCTRVLFIGNSYTFQNDLPRTFAALARAGGHGVETAMAAEGGWRLADHAASRRTLDVLGESPWDYVVLQEQSQIPSVEQLRAELMYPAARSLARRIAEEDATPLLFLTWAHRRGWPERGLGSYEQMQAQIRRGYLGIARELKAPVAPAGEAWLQARRRLPRLELWEPDGSHPGAAGTYLAACVFYATLFRESPEGLAYTAGLPAETARALQEIAAEVVLERPEQWGLP